MHTTSEPPTHTCQIGLLREVLIASGGQDPWAVHEKITRESAQAQYTQNLFSQARARCHWHSLTLGEA